ncbi:MAG: hypothetical protein MUD08_18210, partial [Cytophagales bacterium]|nr:hypothetical protein [Cytophagales bacterium]
FAQTGSTAILRTVSRRILADEKLRKNLTACLPIIQLQNLNFDSEPADSPRGQDKGWPRRSCRRKRFRKLPLCSLPDRLEHNPVVYGEPVLPV